MSLKKLKPVMSLAGVAIPFRDCFASHEEVRDVMLSPKALTGSVTVSCNEPVLVLEENESIPYTRISSAYTMVDGNKIWTTAGMQCYATMARILTPRGIVWVDPSHLCDLSE